MIQLLLQLLIVAIVLGLVIWLVQQIPGVAPFANIVRAVAICLFVIYIIWVVMAIVDGGHLPALK